MRSIDVANYFVAKYGDHIRLTNLSLNKLVYFAQVESLRRLGRPLFSDEVEAWEYGPVEPLVYHSFKRFGRYVVTEASGPFEGCTKEETDVMDSVMDTYGSLTAYDLVTLSHKEGGAWRNRYVQGVDNEITTRDIVESEDFRTMPDLKNTLSAGIENVKREWANTIRLLGDA